MTFFMKNSQKSFTQRKSSMLGKGFRSSDIAAGQMRALVFKPPPPPQWNGIHFGNNVKTSDVALYSGYYVQTSESIEKNIGGYVLRKPNVRWKTTFLNSLMVPKNLKGGTFWDFQTSIMFQNIKKMKGDPLVQSKNFRKKVSKYRKKIQVKIQIAKVHQKSKPNVDRRTRSNTHQRSR